MPASGSYSLLPRQAPCLESGGLAPGEPIPERTPALANHARAYAAPSVVGLKARPRSASFLADPPVSEPEARLPTAPAPGSARGVPGGLHDALGAPIQACAAVEGPLLPSEEDSRLIGGAGWRGRRRAGMRRDRGRGRTSPTTKTRRGRKSWRRGRRRSSKPRSRCRTQPGRWNGSRPGRDRWGACAP